MGVMRRRSPPNHLLMACLRYLHLRRQLHCRPVLCHHPIIQLQQHRVECLREQHLAEQLFQYLPYHRWGALLLIKKLLHRLLRCPFQNHHNHYLHQSCTHRRLQHNLFVHPPCTHCRLQLNLFRHPPITHGHLPHNLFLHQPRTHGRLQQYQLR